MDGPTGERDSAGHKVGLGPLVQVTSFRFDAALTADFLAFGYTLYLENARRIHPFRRVLARQLAPEYPFYNRPGNDHRLFLVQRGAEVVGRVAAMVNAALRAEDGRPIGLIGFFECVDDPLVADALLDAACGWLRAEHGLERIWGPVNFDTWHSYRFMTRGFDEEPFYGEPANKPWYPAFFERYGFRIRGTWNTFEIRGQQELEALVVDGKKSYAAALARGYRYVSGEDIDRRRDLPLLHELVSRSFQAFLGWTPISLADFTGLYWRQWTTVAKPMSFLMFDAEDRPVAFAITFYELSAAVRAMHGRQGPVSKARFLIGRRSVQRVNLFAAGGIPEVQRRGIGLGAAGLYYVVDHALQNGFDDVIFALMAIDSPVQKLFRRAPSPAQREYALYEL